MIKAPYNFVPLSEKVVFPEWASQISHDIPFSDGISGTISVTLTAKSPIFVSNGNASRDGDNKSNETESFCRLDSKSGKYFIPGTSVKGAIRNVLEIMSFSKMRLDQNAKFAEREWNNPSLYTLKDDQGSLRCGWLRPKGDNYEIIDCGKPYRIAQTRIDDYLGTHVFKDNFSDSCSWNLNKERTLNGKKYDPKTAEFKYRLIENYGKSLKNLRDCFFVTDDKFATKKSPNRMKIISDTTRVRNYITGTVVLTGQPRKWKYSSAKDRKVYKDKGKFYEFVFKKSKEGTIHNISSEEFDRYKFIYADSPDWKYAVEKFLNLPDFGIPVFFRIDENSGKIKDWGLAFLYKLPYDKTPRELLSDAHRSDVPDMAECIFGYVHDKSALKGRVQFTPFWCEDAHEENSRRLALCGPKASYYPIYISQEGIDRNGGKCKSYKTYNNGKLKGWKRYVLRKKVWQDCTKSNSIDTSIVPLSPGTIFKGKIIFHNLKPEELGALLSALTFHGNEDITFHQLGKAKPYGYGKVKVNISLDSLVSVGKEKDLHANDYRSFMAQFERYMNQKFKKGSWTNNRAIKELFTLARHNVNDNSSFDYMKLNKNGANEFLAAKGGKGTRYALQYFSNIIKESYQMPSLISGDEAQSVSVKNK